MELDISPREGQPAYKQIAEQIKTRICDGRLLSGTRLPPVRRLADTLGVSYLTVHNAYRELQAQNLVTSVVGRGTVVLGETHFADRLQFFERLNTEGMISHYETVGKETGLRSLATAVPDPELFQCDDFWQSCNQIRKDSPWAFYYAPSNGMPELQVEIARLLQNRGVKVNSDDIVVTYGASHALATLCSTLTTPGDKVLVDAPTYGALFPILAAYGITPIGVPLKGQNPDIDALRHHVLRDRPKFYYTMPNHHNPTGHLFSIEARKELLKMATHTGLTIIEDDAFGLLSYDHAAPQPLKALDNSGQVILVDTFSKCLMPGFRIGYFVAPAHIKNSAARMIDATLISGSQVIQRGLAQYLSNGFLASHLSRVLPKYKKRRDELMRALKRTMPESVSWTYPVGGFSTWVTLPENVDIKSLCAAALSRGLSFVPGSLFLAAPTNESCLRLTFGTQSPEVIAEAVEILARLINERTVRCA